MSIIINIIKIAFLLGFLIIIHESGHFCVAKLCKMKVEEFSIGFGPAMFSKKRKETIYSIRCVPLGGYVNIPGEIEEVDDENAFCNSKAWKKILVISAGSLVNIVFGIVVFFIIISILSNVTSGFYETIEMMKETIKGFASIFVGKVSIDQMSGPVGISQMIVQTNGMLEFFYLLSLISISLGITNLLPIPALDGGKLLLLIIEIIRGKKLDSKVEIEIQTVGLLLLLFLSVIISAKDIGNLF